MADLKPVSAIEQSQISSEILAFLNQYPSLPVNQVEFQHLKTNTSCMSIFPLPGSGKVREYVNESYSAVYSFNLIYRLIPSSTNERLTGQRIIDDIGYWVSQVNLSDYFTLTNNRKVIDIQYSGSFLSFQSDSGVQDWRGSFILTYNKGE